MAGLANEWLATGAALPDLAPNGGDGFFDLQDFAALAANWMEGI